MTNYFIVLNRTNVAQHWWRRHRRKGNFEFVLTHVNRLDSRRDVVVDRVSQLQQQVGANGKKWNEKKKNVRELNSTHGLDAGAFRFNRSAILREKN